MPSHILKAHDARDLGSRLAFNFEDLRHQAAAQLAAAQQEARELVEQARRDAEKLRQQAHAEGWAAGRTEGLKDAAAQIEQRARQLADERLGEQLQRTLPALTQAAELLRGERDAWRQRWETVALELSLAVAEKLVRHDLAARPERAADMIAAALELAVGQPQIRLKLCPADRAQLGDRSRDVVQALAACADVELIEDASLSPGDCVIETRHGEIDARLTTMLQRIAEELRGNSE